MADRKVAIVTGASSGIGKATAVALAKAGYRVVLVARNEKALAETAKACEDFGQGHLIATGDVSKEDFAVTTFVRIQDHVQLTRLPKNAGVSAPVLAIEDLSLAVFETVMNVNLTGAFLFTREAVKAFKKQSPPGGRIINNGSLAAHVPRPLSAPYTISKHAISGLTKATALEGRHFNIACTQIDIGNAATAMAADVDRLQPSGESIKEATMDVQHVADAVVHIASLPLEVTVLEMNIMATGMPYIGRG